MVTFLLTLDLAVDDLTLNTYRAYIPSNISAHCNRLNFPCQMRPKHIDLHVKFFLGKFPRLPLGGTPQTTHLWAIQLLSLSPQYFSEVYTCVFTMYLRRYGNHSLHIVNSVRPSVRLSVCHIAISAYIIKLPTKYGSRYSRVVDISSFHWDVHVL